MKIVLTIVILMLLVPVGFVVFTYFVPHHLGYTGEQPIGFYRLSVVGYEVTGYNDGEVVTYETYGGPGSLLSYLVSRGAEAAFGVRDWRS